MPDEQNSSWKNWQFVVGAVLILLVLGLALTMLRSPQGSDSLDVPTPLALQPSGSPEGPLLLASYDSGGVTVRQFQSTSNVGFVETFEFSDPSEKRVLVVIPKEFAASPSDVQFEAEKIQQVTILEEDVVAEIFMAGQTLSLIYNLKTAADGAGAKKATGLAVLPAGKTVTKEQAKELAGRAPDSKEVSFFSKQLSDFISSGVSALSTVNERPSRLPP
ncbi:MAG TPA: hypothetical protein VI874_02655, partial [Candidatus Norongarragalinales archaeon]|nr:hypothetical protein [Candidatus Norongarragalinales archaeon]